jgi:hypothetical protein
MRRSLALACLLVCAAGAPALAQDAPRLQPSLVPMRGAREAEFVPRGWMVGGRADGDLNGDGRADRVLRLVPLGTDTTGAIAAAPEAQALVVLLAESGGGWRRGGIAPRLLQTIAPQYVCDLAVRRGVLVVHQNFGMTEVTDLVHRFRLDAASGRFVLIGRDQFNYTRPQGAADTEKFSENYLTGVKLTTVGHWRGERYRETTKTEHIPRRTPAMETIDEDSDG